MVNTSTKTCLIRLEILAFATSLKSILSIIEDLLWCKDRLAECFFLTKMG
jgi:hypothetical protein